MAVAATDDKEAELLDINGAMRLAVRELQAIAGKLSDLYTGHLPREVDNG